MTLAKKQKKARPEKGEKRSKAEVLGHTQKKGDTFPKRIDTAKLQKEVIKERKFSQKKKQEKGTPCFVVLVPYVDALGMDDLSTLQSILQADVLARRHRLSGEVVYLLPAVMLDYIKAIIQCGPKDTRAIHDHLWHVYKNFYKQCERVGVLWDMPRHLFFSLTLQQGVAQDTLWLAKKGFVYDTYDVRYRSVGGQTVLTDTEVTFRKEEGQIFRIKFFIDSKKHTVVGPLDDPTLLFATVALLVHPLDKRYKKMIGKHVIIPIINQTVPIVGDDSVQMSQGTGVLVLTPGHQRDHLRIAQKHGLPYDIYAVDQFGYFTERAGQFAGKDAALFRENIVRFLDDISNLDAVTKTEYVIPYAVSLDEKVFLQASRQWFFGIPEQNAYPDISLKFLPQQEEATAREHIETPAHRCISKQIRGVPRLPFLQGHDKIRYIDIDHILKFLEEKKQKKGIALLLFVLFAFLDGAIDDVFSLQDLLGYFFHMYDRKQIREVYAAYIEKSFSSFPKIGEECTVLLPLFVALRSEANEDIYTAFLSQLDMSPGLYQEEDDQYRIVWEDLLPGSQGGTSSDSFDSMYKAVLETKHLVRLIAGDEIQATYFCIQTPQTASFAPFFYQYLSALRETATLHIAYVSTGDAGKSIPLQQRTDVYSTDSLRMFFAVPTTEKNDFSRLTTYEFFLQKLWNAVRFFRRKDTDLSMTSPTTFQEMIKKEEINFTDMDTRLLTKMEKILEDYSYHMQRGTQDIFFEQLLDFVWYDVCDTYIETIKTEYTQRRKILFSYVIAQSLQLLFPYAPCTTWKLWQLLGFSQQILLLLPFSLPENLKRNYKFSLLMDLLQQWKKWYRNNHPYGKAVILYIQGNRDFLAFVQEHEEFLLGSIKHTSLVYKSEVENLPEDILHTNVVNITIGFGIVHEQEVQVDSIDIQALEEERDQKMQVLQKIRSILRIVSANEVGLREKYETDMETLKIDIEQIDYTLRKAKYGK